MAAAVGAQACDRWGKASSEPQTAHRRRRNRHARGRHSGRSFCAALIIRQWPSDSDLRFRDPDSRSSAVFLYPWRHERRSRRRVHESWLACPRAGSRRWTPGGAPTRVPGTTHAHAHPHDKDRRNGPRAVHRRDATLSRDGRKARRLGQCSGMTPERERQSRSVRTSLRPM
jgi:hypothetical protein